MIGTRNLTYADAVYKNGNNMKFLSLQNKCNVVNEQNRVGTNDVVPFQLTDIREIAVRIARYPKENGKKGRIVVITQGADPTIIVHGVYVCIHRISFLTCNSTG